MADMRGTWPGEVETVEASRWAWPQQSTYGRTALPIEVVSITPPTGKQSRAQVTWRYPDAQEGDVNVTPIGTFLGQGERRA